MNSYVIIKQRSSRDGRCPNAARLHAPDGASMDFQPLACGCHLGQVPRCSPLAISISRSQSSNLQVALPSRAHLPAHCWRCSLAVSIANPVKPVAFAVAVFPECNSISSPLHPLAECPYLRPQLAATRRAGQSARGRGTLPIRVIAARALARSCCQAPTRRLFKMIRVRLQQLFRRLEKRGWWLTPLYGLVLGTGAVVDQVFADETTPPVLVKDQDRTGRATAGVIQRHAASGRICQFSNLVEARNDASIRLGAARHPQLLHILNLTRSCSAPRLLRGFGFDEPRLVLWFVSMGGRLRFAAWHRYNSVLSF